MEENRYRPVRRDGFKDRPRVNEEIRVHYVRVIGVDKKPIGILPTRDAIQLARRQDLDLVELAPNAEPPVAGILDFGRYIYEQKVKDRESKRRQHSAAVREMRFMMRISEHDYTTKMKKVQEFLNQRDRVRVTVRLRGREILHKDLAYKLIERIRADLAPIAIMDGEPTKLGEGGRQSLQIMFFPAGKDKEHATPRPTRREPAARAAKPALAEAKPAEVPDQPTPAEVKKPETEPE